MIGPNHLLSCGAATAVINPPLGVSMAGYFTDRKATGVLDDLYASALVLEKDGAKLVLVACDLIEWPADVARPIREEIARRLGTSLEAVMLTATHTHTGPVLGGELADARYLGWLAERVIQVALEADRRRVRGMLAYSQGNVDRFTFNRRYFMRNGSVLTNPGPDNEDIIRPAGPVDPAIQVIAVQDASQKALAVVVNFANHPDTTGGTLISADWPGHLRAVVQQKIGKHAPVLVLNGAAGDINHFDPMHQHVVKSPQEARQIGEYYGQVVQQTLETATPQPVDRLGAWQQLAPTPYRRISPAELTAAQQTVAELKDDPEAAIHGELESQDIARGSKAVRLMFARSIVDAANNLQGKTLPLEIAVLRLGPQLGLVGVNGEVFTEIGMAIKKNSPFPHTLVAELANGSIGYLGTQTAYQQGGYETMLGERACDEVEDFILHSAMQGLSEV